MSFQWLDSCVCVCVCVCVCMHACWIIFRGLDKILLALDGWMPLLKTMSQSSFSPQNLVGQLTDVYWKLPKYIRALSAVQNPPAMQELRETWVLFLGQKDPLEEGMEPHSSVLAWEIPWTEEPGGQHSIGLQSVGYNWSDLSTHEQSILSLFLTLVIQQWSKQSLSLPVLMEPGIISRT